jgi:DNA modification methylase
MGTANIAEALKPLATPIGDLSPLPGNPRKGDVEAVKRSYQRFGQRKPIVANRDGTVIAGNHQLKAAQALGWDEIAVVFVDDDDQTAKAFALADNRTADLGTYDDQALADLLAEVAIDPELLLATGYSLDDLADLSESLDVGGAIDEPDEVPASAPAKTIKGDVWLLGPHRLMCGDSTVPTDVERLMAGAKANMVWTDPPYGVGYESLGRRMSIKAGNTKTKQHRAIANDDLRAMDLGYLLQGAFSNLVANTVPGSSWFVAAPQGGQEHVAFTQVLIDLGVYRQVIIWVKDSLVLSRSDYHYRHEPLFYGWTPGAAHREPPDRKGDTVWEIPRPKRSEEHPTMKPVALVEKCIERHSARGEIVLDVFGGSGTTMIAAHQLGRVAYLMELDEHYCDIICARFQKATGIKPIAEATGQEHDFLAE